MILCRQCDQKIVLNSPNVGQSSQNIHKGQCKSKTSKLNTSETLKSLVVMYALNLRITKESQEAHVLMPHGKVLMAPLPL
jgi:hypothetical protein